ncbi:helix-turn-helix domain-containing protein [Clostridium saccharoperbutylacetonicum]|uniref:helix-turn-helix domain-containing protein n=1 Tax=Clostridium saccharoperbutylacetonicum TaxID=36745 RepID=UPI000983B841|nr:helix-turn-helix transcriptional regulator [Clostridium saccharoperbutylacetonicum]AQR98139.1 helix-turn-helix domain protein [Clostridium saccharoperbutylacetonicum]NSB34032.1 transcriptional regulator with XRE-family HTH domain [Clostridium saccharoperbutylacetonicum]
MTIAEAIKEYRKLHGLTQSDLAIRINRTIRCVRMYETGFIIPSINVLEQIFNIPFDELITKELAEKGVI